MADFDVRDWGMDDYLRNMQELQRGFPREAKKVLLRVGTKARAIVINKARQLVNKKTGNYFKSIKRGKVWEVDGQYRVRVYSHSNHAHLIEKGHRIVGADGSEHGFVQGINVFDKAGQEITEQFDTLLANELDRIFNGERTR